MKNCGTNDRLATTAELRERASQPRSTAGRMGRRARPGLLLLTLLSVIVAPLQATDEFRILWANTGSNFASDSSWQGGFAPFDATDLDLASMGTSGTILFQPIVSGTYSLRGVEFLAGASAFTFSGTNSGKLILGASGIANNSSSLQTFNSSLTLAIATASRFEVNSSGGLKINGAVTLSSYTLTLAGNGSGQGEIAGVISGTGGVLKTGSGTWVLSGANSYFGTTRVDAGTLIIASGGSLASSTNLIVNGGTLAFKNTAQTVASLSGTGGTINFGSGHVLTIAQTGSKTYSGTFTGVGSLVVSGAETLTLSGGGSVTGGLQVQYGATLKLGANNGVANFSTVTLNNGTFSLGTYSYTSTAGLQILSGGGTIDFGTGAGTHLTFGDSSGYAWSGSLSLVNFTPGVDSIRFGNSGSGLSIAQLQSINFGAGFQASIDANGFVTGTAIPEPSQVAALMAVAALGLAFYRRKRGNALVKHA